MLKTILESIIVFASTDIDDLIVLMLFFTSATSRQEQSHIIIGQYLGIGFLVAVSLLAATGLRILPASYLHLLGIIPLFLGLKSLYTLIHPQKEEQIITSSSKKHGLWLVVTLTAIANGADNLGIFIPFFSNQSANEQFITIIIFLVLIGVWCWISKLLIKIPLLHQIFDKYQKWIVPFVFIIIGLTILINE